MRERERFGDVTIKRQTLIKRHLHNHQTLLATKLKLNIAILLSDNELEYLAPNNKNQSKRDNLKERSTIPNFSDTVSLFGGYSPSNSREREDKM